MAKVEEINDNVDKDGLRTDQETRLVRENTPPSYSQRPSSRWKRVVALIALLVLLFHFGYPLLKKRKPQVVYASRYSTQHKFRPAASPIITETLKDGRTRLRGALPTPTPTPTKTPARKRRSTKSGRASGKARRKRSPAVAKQ